MHIAQWIYLALSAILLSDVLFMVFNFEYSYEMHKIERESMFAHGNPKLKRRIDLILFSEYGFFRIFIKGFIYYVWFALGFFLQFWYLHIGIFIFNYLQEMVIRDKLNVPVSSYFLKLTAYFVLYLGIIHQLIM